MTDRQGGTMTTDRPVRRHLVVLLVLTVLATALVALRPTGTTMAAWSDEVSVTVPALSTGGVAVTVTPDGATRASIAVTGDAAGTWRPASVRVAVDGRSLTGTELAGSRIEYRVAVATGQCPSGTAPYTVTPSGGGTSFTVAGNDRLSGTATLCLTFLPSDQFRIQQGGRALTLTTTLDGVAARTWTATGDWAAAHTMAAGPSVPGATCSAGPLSRVTIGWGWDRSGMSQDVSRWSLQMYEDGRWNELRTVAAGARTAQIERSDFRAYKFQDYPVRVAAVLPDGTTILSDTTAVRIEQLLIFGKVYCA